LIRAAQVDGRLKNCWINELSYNNTLEWNVLLKTGVIEIGRKSECFCGVAVLLIGLKAT